MIINPGPTIISFPPSQQFPKESFVLEITTLSSTIRLLIVIWFTTSSYYLLAKPVVLVFPMQALFTHLHYYITFTNPTTVTDQQVNRWLVLCMLPEAGTDLLEVYLASFSTNLPTTLETKLTATITIVITPSLQLISC
jgi:hypothetical protein